MSRTSVNEPAATTDQLDATAARNFCDQSREEVAGVFVDKDSQSNVTAPINDKLSSTDTVFYYKGWSDQYEKDMENCDYQGPCYAVEAFARLNLSRDVRILDVLAGSGLVASLLRERGYENIDGIDGCDKMQRVAAEKQVYKKYYVSLLGKEHKAPIADDTYDAIVASGCFGPGHLYPDVIPDLIRIVRKGGFLVWCMRKDYGKVSPPFVHFDDEVDRSVSSNVWRYYEPRKQVYPYFLRDSGYVYVMQKV